MVTEKKEENVTSADSQEKWEKNVSLTYDRNNPPPKTRGEQIFNALSWGFFGWIVNATVSIKLADLATYRFRPFFVENSAKLAETRLFKHFFKDDKERKTLAHTFFSVVALLPGGFSVLLPIKWMENAKSSIVKSIDNALTSSHQSENEKKEIEARHEYIDHAPKIGWWDLIKGRFLPIVMVLSTHLSFASHPTNLPNIILNKLGSEKKFSGLDSIYGNMGKNLYERISNAKIFGLGNLVSKTERYLDKGMIGYIEKARPEHVKHYFTDSARTSRLTGKDRMKEFVGNSVVDIGYSAGVAFWTFVASHFFAFKDEVKREAITNNQQSTPRDSRKFHLDNTQFEIKTAPAPSSPLTHIEAAQYNSKLAHTPALQESRIS